MADRQPPDDDRLCRLIHEAYEYLPGPDMSRLYRLQESLSRQTAVTRAGARPRRLPWWIALLLISGAVAAAWWAGVTLLHLHPVGEGVALCQ